MCFVTRYKHTSIAHNVENQFEDTILSMCTAKKKFDTTVSFTSFYSQTVVNAIGFISFSYSKNIYLDFTLVFIVANFSTAVGFSLFEPSLGNPLAVDQSTIRQFDSVECSDFLQQQFNILF